MKIITFFIPLVLIFLGMVENLFSTEKKLKFEHISAKHKLTCNSVFCILQDSQGFLWVGCSESLLRYDGYGFKVYGHDPKVPYSISKYEISAIVEDHSGIIWVGTYGGGLNRFNRENETFSRYKCQQEDPNSLSNNTITSMITDKFGMLWIGTWGGGLNKYNPKNNQFSRFEQIPQNDNSSNDGIVYSLFEDNSGKIWIGTWGEGLYKFDPIKKIYSNYRCDSQNPNTISNDYIRVIFEDHQGFIWIGTENGLNKMEPQKGASTYPNFIHYMGNSRQAIGLTRCSITSIHESPIEPGIFWIGTNEGLKILNVKENSFAHYGVNPMEPGSLSSLHIRCFYEDRSGVIWIGTRSGGLNRFYRGQTRFTTYSSLPSNPNSLSYKNVLSIYEDNNDVVWIGTLGGGLNKFDRKKNQFTHFKYNPENPKSLSDNIVTSIIEEDKDTLWVATYRGVLNKFHKKTGLFAHLYPNPLNPNGSYYDPIFSVYRDRLGSLWVGTVKGLYKYNREEGTFTCHKIHPKDLKNIRGNAVSMVFEDKYGIFWVGTGDGLYIFNPETGEFTPKPSNPIDPQAMKGNTVLVIYEDHSGTLWFGTDQGLNKLDRSTGTFTNFQETEGLPNNTICGILEDQQGYLWISTQKGLSQFNPKKETFKNYFIQDGLQSNEFNALAYHKNESGEMIFGGANGFNIFHPEEIKENSYIPPIVFTNFKIFSRPVAIANNGSSPLKKTIDQTKEIILNYKKNVFSFEFASLDFSIPEKNQYAYKLEGINKDWMYLGNNRNITFANLPPGNYILKIKGSNNDGVWNEIGTSIKIIITPPFWKTQWFQILIVVFILIFIFKLYRMRIKFLTFSLKQKAKLDLLCKKYDISKREKEIIELMLRGMTNQDIEDKLYISLNTVKSHVYSIYQKLGVKNRIQLFNLLDSS
jgi:ligand-binding sensor domain-containing protein/DNA-binding CsgD family transcriptional regulator